MQGNASNYGTDYVASGLAFAGVANPPQPGPPVPQTSIGGQQFPQSTPVAPTPTIRDDISLSTEAEASGQLCSVQLPVASASPTQSAWCSVSNLVAVAFTPEPDSSTARILIIDPSNAEDVTQLELPMAGPADWITCLEWSWPGQRRALLTATASGRVVVWTQNSQQGQDDAVYPRCIDDWHGQLLLDIGPSSSSTNTTDQQHQQHHVKQEQGSRPSGGFVSAAGVSYIKQESSGHEPPDGYSKAPADDAPKPQQQQQRMQPVLAGVSWLRQPAGGRIWSTSSLAMKRLDAGTEAGGGGGGGGGAQSQAQGTGQGGPQENLESLFCEEAAAPGAVPHWARPNQLTAAVLTATGSLTILWVMASKLPNTLSWYRSKNVRIPPPPEVATEVAGDGGGTAAAGGAEPGSTECRIARVFMCAVHDGSLSLAVVYGRRRDVIYLYNMRGNPTLSGQLVTQTRASTAAAAGGGDRGGTARDAPLVPPPTVAMTGRLAVPQGLAVQQCRMHLYGGGTKRLYVLSRKPIPPGQSHSGMAVWGSHLQQQQQQQQQLQPVLVFCFAEMLDEKGGGAGWRVERSSPQLLEPYGSGGASASASASASAAAAATELSLDLGISTDGSKLVVPYGSMLYTLDAETLTVLSAKDLAEPHGAAGYAATAVPPGSAYGNDSYGNGNSIGARPDLAAVAGAQPMILALTGCLSANSCCLCSVVRVRHRDLDSAASWGELAFWPDSSCSGDDADGGGGDVVMLQICTVPDVVPPPSGSAAAAGGAASLERIEDIIACNMDTMRLAWGALHRHSVWDVAERLRCTWLSGRTEHVYRSLDQLDILLYSTDDSAWRIALSQHMTRAKLEVLRRLPHPQAAVLAADMLAGARVMQYSDTLAPVYGAQSEALSHPETRTVAAHMVWFVLEVLTLMLAGLKLWADAAAAEKASRAAAAAAPQGGQGEEG
ncbi:hypothetical protein Vretifemale_9685, partial [Volvox reticuliferus]